MGRIKIEVPPLHLPPNADLDKTTCSPWILSFPAVPQTALVQMDHRYAAHSIT
jgi:hypothetical protein